MEIPDTCQFLTPKEAAPIFGVHHSTIIAWIKSGTLQAYNFRPNTRCGRYLIPATTIRKLIDGEEVSVPALPPEPRGHTLPGTGSSEPDDPFSG